MPDGALSGRLFPMTLSKLTLLLAILWVLATACSSGSGGADQASEAGVVEVTTTVLGGTGASDQALERFPASGESVLVETIEHIATVVHPGGDIWLYHYDETNSFCWLRSAEGSVAASCSSNDQLASGKPFLRQPGKDSADLYYVWVSGAPVEAVRFEVASNTGSLWTSGVINRTGYVIVEDATTPVEAMLLDADGNVVWTDTVRT